MLVFVLSLFLYICSYLSLSLNGRFEPATIGLNGVKDYRWAPKGFVTDFKWNSKTMLFYLPLYYIDDKFWHTEDTVSSGKYPVDWVERKDIWKVYKAYDLLDK